MQAKQHRFRDVELENNLENIHPINQTKVITSRHWHGPIPIPLCQPQPTQSSMMLPVPLSLPANPSLIPLHYQHLLHPAFLQQPPTS